MPIVSTFNSFKLSVLSAVLLAGFSLCAGSPGIGGVVWKAPDFDGRSNEPFASVKDKVLTIKAGEDSKASDKELLQNRDVLGGEAKSAAKTNYTVAFSMGKTFSPLRGYLLEFAVDVKGDVPVAEYPWEGIRISVNYAVEGEDFVYSYNGLGGKFGWKRVSFVTRVPYDLVDVSLSLGILGKSGTVQFRNPVITVKEKPRCLSFPKNPPPKYKGHNLPRLRGFNSATDTLAWYPAMKIVNQEWGSNIITATFNPGKKILKDKELDAHLQKVVYDYFDNTEKIAADAGMYYIIQMSDDFHDNTKPFHSDLFYHKPEYVDFMVDIWTRIAEHYKGCKYLYGFQLINESCFRVPKQPGCSDYEDAMERIAQAINKVDPERTIIIQPEEWWGMRAFDKMRPIKAKNVVYAPHFYAPMRFSHQGAIGEVGVKYPGMINGRMWNKETLRKTLRPGLDFQKRYNVHMIVTEFSAIAVMDPESRENWTRDIIELFEEYGWDWTWHAINEFPGWRPNAIASDFYDKTPERWGRGESYKFVEETPTSKVIKSWMAKNKYLPRIPLKDPEKYKHQPSKPQVQEVPKPVIDFDYPVENVKGFYYVTSSKGMNFTETKHCHVASWKVNDNPTIEGVFDLNKTEWTPFVSEFKVIGNGHCQFVFNPSEAADKKPGWISLKDLKVEVNGKECKCSWPLMGYALKDKTGKTYYVVSKEKHIYAAFDVKDGDTVKVTGVAKRTTPEDLK